MEEKNTCLYSACACTSGVYVIGAGVHISECAVALSM